MNQGIVLGWFVIPAGLGGVFGSVVYAAWRHFAGKELSRLESRLRKEEETSA